MLIMVSNDGFMHKHSNWTDGFPDAVSGTMLHVSGSVVASCSGQRHFERDQHDLAESDDRSTDESRRVKKITCESSLKIWVT